MTGTTQAQSKPSLRPSRPGCPAGGFTLPELMTVLVILGLLGFLAIGRTTQQGRGDAALGLTREVYTRLTQARFAAISSGTRVQVTLSPVSVSAVQLRTSLQPGMVPPPPADFGPVTDEVTAHRGAQIVAIGASVDTGNPPPGPAGGPALLIFYPDGRARLDGAIASQPGTTIYIADELFAHPHRIVVLARTGFARTMDF